MTLWYKIFIGFNGLMMLLSLFSENLHSLVFFGFLFIAAILLSFRGNWTIKVEYKD